MMFRMSVLKRESTWSESGDPVLHTLNQLSTQRRETAECRGRGLQPLETQEVWSQYGLHKNKTYSILQDCQILVFRVESTCSPGLLCIPVI